MRYLTLRNYGVCRAAPTNIEKRWEKMNLSLSTTSLEISSCALGGGPSTVRSLPELPLREIRTSVSAPKRSESGMEARARSQPGSVSPPELYAVTKGLPGGRASFHDLILTPSHS